MPKKPAAKKKVVAKKKAVKKPVVTATPVPDCPKCGKPLDLSLHAADEGVLKRRCVNEQCVLYGQPQEVPNG